MVVTALAAQALAQSATDTDRSAPGAGARTGATRTGTDAGAQPGQADKLAQHVAICLTLGNQEEIQLGQFAQQRAQNPQVKQFAQTMVEEHGRAVQQLQQAMPEVASLNLELNAQAGAGEAGATSATQRPGSTTRAETPGTTSANGNQRAAAGAQAGMQQMVDFAREVKQECLNLTTQELGRKQGADFDKCYISQQIVAHTGMLAELRVAQRHLQNEKLQPVLQQGTQMTEHHLAQAKQIMEQLDAGGAQGERTGQRPTPGAQPTARQ
jgi:predicted outer membrane protein